MSQWSLALGRKRHCQSLALSLVLAGLFVCFFLPPTDNGVQYNNLYRNSLFSHFKVMTNLEREQIQEYVQKLSDIRDGRLTEPELVTDIYGGINLGMIMINLANSSRLEDGFSKRLTKTWESLLAFSTGTPINMIILTDAKSLGSVSRFLGDLVSRLLASRVIISPDWRWRRRKALPPLSFTYVDSAKVVAKGEDFVKELQGLTLQQREGVSVEKDRYVADLFFMAPLYHLAFTGLDQLVVLDATDLQFHTPVLEVWQQMEAVSRQGAVVGIGRDLSPNYHYQLDRYRREHPGSDAGMPGDTQGRSVKYNKYTASV